MKIFDLYKGARLLYVVFPESSVSIYCYMNFGIKILVLFELIKNFKLQLSCLVVIYLFTNKLSTESVWANFSVLFLIASRINFKSLQETIFETDRVIFRLLKGYL